MTKKHPEHKKHQHPSHQKIPLSRNHRAIWVIGLSIFIMGIIIDSIYVIVPGGMLAIYGIMNRHSWHLHHIK